MKEHIYSLGKRHYKLHSTDKNLLDLLDRLLPKHQSNEASLNAVSIDLDEPLKIRGLAENLYSIENPTNALIYLIDRALADHEGYIWIDASALLTPKGSLVLIAGPSHSGKTTLTLALTLSHNWKIVAEDIVLIDSAGILAPFARPLSLRPDTAEKIKQATSIDPNAFMLQGWIANQDWYDLQPRPASFDLCLDLAVTDHSSTEALETHPATISEFQRRLLSHSNVLRYDNGLERLSGCLPTSKFCLLSGGSLAERLRSILSLTGC